MRAPVTFKQADVTRAYKGVVKAGGEVATVEIARDGRIIVRTVGPDASATGPNDWDGA